MAGGALGNFHIASAVRQRHNQMHTRLAPEHLDHGSEFAADTVYQRAPSLAMENPHSSKVTGKMPFANKVRKNFLIEGWRARW